MTLEKEVRQFCSERHLRLNKDLGQHFLIDQNKLDQIVAAGNIQDNDHIVEIGPGIGVLTRELLRQARQVTTIELDTRFIELLKQFTEVVPENERQNAADLTVMEGNALHVPYPSLPYKIIANIPYHITSPLLRKCFLESERHPTTMTLLIQKEVAEKICSDKDAGLLTILVSLFGTPRIVTDVPPKCFLPPPKVDSAVLHIDCFEKPIAEPAVIEQIFKLTKLAFSQKRKMLRNTIGSLPEGDELMSKAGIDPSRRPQTLGIEEWIAVAEQLASSN